MTILAAFSCHLLLLLLLVAVGAARKTAPGRETTMARIFPATAAAAAPAASAVAAGAARKTAPGRENTMARKDGEARKLRTKTA